MKTKRILVREGYVIKGKRHFCWNPFKLFNEKDPDIWMPPEYDIVTDVEVDGTSVVTNGVAEITMPTVPTQASDIGAVPTTTSVNGKALSNDITLVATDVGASLARIVRW